MPVGTYRQESCTGPGIAHAISMCSSGWRTFNSRPGSTDTIQQSQCYIHNISNTNHAGDRSNEEQSRIPPLQLARSTHPGDNSRLRLETQVTRTSRQLQRTDNPGHPTRLQRQHPPRICLDLATCLYQPTGGYMGMDETLDVLPMLTPRPG